MNMCQNQTHESLTSVIAEILVMQQYKMDKWATSEKSKWRYIFWTAQNSVKPMLWKLRN